MPALNLRFLMGGFHNQSVRILHASASEDTYRHVAQLLNGRVTAWHHSAVFLGGKLFAPSGTEPRDVSRQPNSAPGG